MPTLKAGTRQRVALILNGKPASGWAAPRTLLSDFLRHEIGATGTHVGCEHGVCGACTVQFDGLATRSCLVLAVQAEGRRIDTVEGLGRGDRLSILQEAFRRNFALQCGFCTPGILMSLEDYLARHPAPTEEQIRIVLGGHLCRCTGYVGIVHAALEAAAMLQEEKKHA